MLFTILYIHQNNISISYSAHSQSQINTNQINNMFTVYTWDGGFAQIRKFANYLNCEFNSQKSHSKRIA